MRGAALLERGRMALHAGQLTEAEKWLREAVAVAPRYNVEAYRALCRCLEAAGKTEEVRQALDEIRIREAEVLDVECLTLRANRGPRDVGLRYEVAQKLLRLGREADGVAVLLLIVEQEPRHAPAHAALADYFERAGQPGRATRHRRASLAGAGATIPAR